MNEELNLESLTKAIDEAKERNKEAREIIRKSKGKKKTPLVTNTEPELQTEDLDDEKLERLKEDIPEEVEAAQQDRWKPFKLEGEVPPKFNIPVNKSNNCDSYNRDRLSRVLRFIEFTRRKRFKEGCTVIPIPTTSRQNLLIWGYPMAVSRDIKFMEKIGLIKVFDSRSHWGSPFEGGNYSRLFCYFKDNEDKAIQYCKEHNIEMCEIIEVEEITTQEQVEKIEKVDEARTFALSDVRFGKDLNIEKPEGVSKTELDMFLVQCLYLNYPELKFHQIKVKEINDRYYKDYPEFRLRFRPHIIWKGNKVVKIGIRLTNECCCVSKEDRKELLKQYGFHLEKDVRSSVPRLTLSINEGHWIDEDIDIYKLINDEFEPGSECTPERRENIKKYALPTYFEDGSEKMLGKNLLYQLGKTGLNKEEVDSLMGRLRTALVKAVGGRTFGSDIFYIESCVYLMTLYDLLTSWHKVWLVYDAFYSNGDEDEETFEKMVAHSVKMNFRYFMEISEFRKYSKAVEDQDEKDEKSLSVRDILNKYNINTLVNK